MMRRVCAYCKRDMGEAMGPDGMVTHGICKSCLELSEDERAWEIEKYGRCLTAEERRDADIAFAPKVEEIKHLDDLIAEMNRERKPLAVELSEDDYPLSPEDEEGDETVCKDTGEPRAECTSRECCYERDLQDGDRKYDEMRDRRDEEARK